MADNKIKFLRGTSSEYTAAEKDSDTIYFTTDDGKLYIGDKEVSGESIKALNSHINDNVKHITSAERTNWNAAKSHADSAHAPSNAQANVIETIKVNGTALTPSSKAVDITVPSVGNGTITIKQAGTTKGTFTTNQSGNTTIELTDNNTWRDVVDNLTSTDATKSLSANQGKVLKGLVDGKAAASHTHSAMTGATSSAAGTSGLVPAPAAGDQDKFLKADGTWQEAGGSNKDCLPLSGGVVTGNVQQSGGTTDYDTYKFRNIGFGNSSTPSRDANFGGNGSIYFYYS